MNRAGQWVHEGQQVVDGKVSGERRRSNIASYWLGGVAAAYQRWDSIVLKYLQAVATYGRTGDEMPLKATVNTDQGAPYIPRAALKRRGSEELMTRAAKGDWPKGSAPAAVRFLTGSVDVQGNRFVCSVYGWGVGLESWLVDRFSISSSLRPEADRTAALDPASFEEDWRVLESQIIARRYPGRRCTRRATRSVARSLRFGWPRGRYRECVQVLAQLARPWTRKALHVGQRRRQSQRPAHTTDLAGRPRPKGPTCGRSRRRPGMADQHKRAERRCGRRPWPRCSGAGVSPSAAVGR